MMNIRKMAISIRNYFKMEKILNNKENKMDSVAAGLIRNIHSIEKGLCIENPRLGFGQEKIEMMLERVQKLKDSSSSYHKEIVKMAKSCLNAYINYMDEQSFSNDFIMDLKEKVKEFEPIDIGMGGVKKF